MSRFGYAALILIILLAGGYLLWPHNEPRALRLELPRQAPLSFTLSNTAYRQIRDHDTITINSVTRPVDSHAIQQLWSSLRGVRLQPQQSITLNDPADRLRLYGLSDEQAFHEYRFKCSVVAS